MSQSAVASVGSGESGAGWEQEPGGGASGDVRLAAWGAVGRVQSGWEMVQREPGSEVQKSGVWAAGTSACGHTGSISTLPSPGPLSPGPELLG